MTVNGESVLHVTRMAGTGGHVTYGVDVRSPGGALHRCEFSGNVFGGPVLLTRKSADGHVDTTEVPQPRRFGEFATAQWVHDFFGHRPEASHALLDDAGSSPQTAAEDR